MRPVVIVSLLLFVIGALLLAVNAAFVLTPWLADNTPPATNETRTEGTHRSKGRSAKQTANAPVRSPGALRDLPTETWIIRGVRSPTPKLDGVFGNLDELDPTVSNADALVLTKAENSVMSMRVLGAAVSRLPDGQLMLQAPKNMAVEDTRIVTAVVGVDVQNLPSSLPVKEDTQTVRGELKVSYQMSAELVGGGFEIERLTPEIRAVPMGLVTNWKWKVKATSPGDTTLEATLYAHMSSTDGVTPVVVSTYSQPVSISVRAQSWGEWIQSATTAVNAAQALWLSVAAFGGVVFTAIFTGSFKRVVAGCILPIWAVLRTREKPTAPLKPITRKRKAGPNVEGIPSKS